MIPHFKVLETCLFTRVYISGFVCIPVTTSFYLLLVHKVECFIWCLLRSQTAIAGSYNSGSSERDKSGDSRSSDLNLVYFVWTSEGTLWYSNTGKLYFLVTNSENQLCGN